MSFGLSAALLTPFHEDKTINFAELGSHARQLIDKGVDSVTLFGTTGEGASCGTHDRANGIESLLAAHCPEDKIILGVCATSIEEASRQIDQGLFYGISRFLVLPPFYFREPLENGLFDWYSTLLDTTSDESRFLLYHIPQITNVELSVDLVKRLYNSHPNRITAIKDSSGDWNTAKAFLKLRSIPVLVGDERLLHKAMPIGAEGAISGMANLHPERMKRIIETHTEDKALTAEVSRIVSIPVIPALKESLAAQNKVPAWCILRPPLTPLSTPQRSFLNAH